MGLAMSEVSNVLGALGVSNDLVKLGMVGAAKSIEVQSGLR